MNSPPTPKDVRAAAERIAPYAHRTPVATCAALDELAGARLFLKCESFQKVGAFKFRGACNAVMSMGDAEVSRGVATHSSGNHAAALALAARLRDVPAHIVMPENAPGVKRRAVEGYGARIVQCAPTQQAREDTLERVVKQTGAAFIHPYEDSHVVAGQGTAALELMDEIDSLDLVLTPVGGGGLLSGTAIAVADRSPGTKVVAAEPAGADDAYRSFREGRRLPLERPDTICDGLRTCVGELAWEVMRRRVTDVVRVDDEAIVRAMRLVWERAKIVIEPSAAVPIAAAFEGVLPRADRVGVIVSGGNVDLDALPW